MIRKTLYWIKKKIAARNRTFQSYFEHQPCTIISCNCIGQHPEIVYVKKDRNKRMVDDLTKYINTRGTKVYEYYFDFDKWLTGNFETGDCKYER